MQYVSPGGAFSSAFEDTLAQQAALKHQALLEQLAVQREQREAQSAVDEHKYRMAELQDKVVERQAKAELKKAEDTQRQENADRADVEKSIANRPIGDIPDAQELAKLKKYAPWALKSTPTGGAVVGANTEAEASMGMTGPPVMKMAGTPQMQQQATQKQQQQAIINGLPANDPRRVSYEAEAAGLHAVAAPTVKNISDANYTLPGVGSIVGQRNSEGRVLYHGQDVTDMVQPYVAPKDTSAREGAAEDRKNAHVDSIREHAYSELDKRATPVESEIQNIRKLDLSMKDNSNIGDAVVAEQVLKATAGGQGSGLRLTQPLINQILSGSRTKWDDLSLSLNKWMGDKNPDGTPKPLILTPDQKTAIYKLGRALRTQATALQEKIIKARRAVDDATTINQIDKARTDLQEALTANDTPETPAEKPSAADLIKKYSQKP